MASCLIELQKKYQGETLQETLDVTTRTVTYQGSKELCEESLERRFKKGKYDPDNGTVIEATVNQAEGPFWNVVVTYQLFHEELHSTLGTVIQQNPIEIHKNYKRIWDNDVYFCSTSNTLEYGLYNFTDEGIIVVKPPAPELYQVIMNMLSIFKTYDKYWPVDKVFTLDGYNFMMFSQIALSDYVNPAAPTAGSLAWMPIASRTKPGVSTYSFPTYQMTQTFRSSTKSDASKYITKNIGKIMKPEKGDFEINKRLGGNWLCEGGAVNNDGHQWITELTFVHSGDSNGWDQDIYEKAPENE